MQAVLGFLAQHVFGLGSGSLITAGVAYAFKKFGTPWLEHLNTVHFQKAVALGAMLAREICLGLHDENLFQGNAVMPKLEEAANQLVKSMAEAGFIITVSGAKAKIQAAHSDLTLSKTTRYNDAPPANADAKQVFGARAFSWL